MANAILKPNKYPLNNIKENLQQNPIKQKKYYHAHAKELMELKINWAIIVQQNERFWKSGKVLKDYNPNDYLVRINKTDYRRNRKFFKPLVAHLKVKKVTISKISAILKCVWERKHSF